MSTVVMPVMNSIKFQLARCLLLRTLLCCVVCVNLTKKLMDGEHYHSILYMKKSKLKQFRKQEKRVKI